MLLGIFNWREQILFIPRVLKRTKKVLVSHERCGDPGCVVCWGLAQWRGTMGGPGFVLMQLLLFLDRLIGQICRMA